MSVREALEAHPEAFEFFQAVRLWMLDHVRSGGSLRQGAVGSTVRRGSEFLHFRGQLGLSFPSTQIASRDERSNHDKPSISAGNPAEGGDEQAAHRVLDVAFMGMVGTMGALPRHYTELVMQRLREPGDRALREFLAFFEHRLISIFQRASAKYRLPFAYENARLQGEAEGPFRGPIDSIAGFGTPGLKQRLTVDDEVLTHYAGLLSMRPRSASALGTLLSDYFGFPVAVEQFRGRWLHLREEERTQVGVDAAGRGHHAALGVEVVLGEKVWDVQGCFGLLAGPLTYDQLLGLLPGIPDEAPHLRIEDQLGLARMRDLTRTFAGPELDFDVSVEVRAEEVPGIRLGHGGNTKPRLGWNTWLQDPTRDCGPGSAWLTLDIYSGLGSSIGHRGSTRRSASEGAEPENFVIR